MKVNSRLEAIACMCHEVNRAYCLGISETPFPPSWDDAPEWMRESAVNGVKFLEEFPDAPPRASHDSWMKDKLESGWKYGPIKDAVAKEHPCLLPYEDLPASQKVKDYLFQAVVRTMNAI